MLLGSFSFSPAGVAHRPNADTRSLGFDIDSRAAPNAAAFRVEDKLSYERQAMRHTDILLQAIDDDQRSHCMHVSEFRTGGLRPRAACHGYHQAGASPRRQFPSRWAA